MKLTIQIELHTNEEPSTEKKYPGYTQKEITRKGTTYKQWYWVGPRHISKATRAAEHAGLI